MKNIVTNGISLWKFKVLEDQVHFVTGRLGGVSPAPYDSLNLSFTTGDDNENVIENRRLLALSIGIMPENLLFVSQCHSNEIVLVNSNADVVGKNADALLTNVPGLCLCVMGADCVPVLVYDPNKRVAAAIHAGWKGTVASITSKTLETMQLYFGCRMQDVKIGIGPSISQDKYEVGVEVYEQFKTNFGTDVERIFKHHVDSGKYFPDLWMANKMQAMKMGVREKNIEISEICTFSNPNDFFSARFFKNQTGRFAAGIMIS